MGDNDQAAYWLEKGLDEGSLWLNDLTVHIPKLRLDPKFDSPTAHEFEVSSTDPGS